MPPRSSHPRRNRKRRRTNSDSDEVPTSANAVDKVASPHGLKEASPSQSSQPSSLRRSQRLRRTGPNPDPTIHGEVLVSNTLQTSQASVALVEHPASRSSRNLTSNKSLPQALPFTRSGTQKKSKRSQKEAVKDIDRAVGVAGGTRIPQLTSSAPESTSTSSLPASAAPPSHVETVHPVLSAVTPATDTPGHEPDRTGPAPSIQLSAIESSIAAGRDFGSGNVLQHGHGNVAFGNSNSVHIHNALLVDEHDNLISRIREKLGAYITEDATLSKDLHGDPSTCYHGTREGLLDHVLSWVEGSPTGTKEDVHDVARRALCIVGAPGSGKSTIMNTLVINLLRDAISRSPGLIAAHYCIRRSLHSTTDGSKVLPTLMLQLARRNLSIAKRILTLLDETLHTDVFAPQLQEEVFLKVISAYNQIIFVIIDGLDEASNPASLAATLSRVIPPSTPNLRLLLATRNEHGVLQGLGEALVPKIAHTIPTEESVDEVGSYITGRLKDGIRELFGSDHSWSHWPDDSQLRGLSNKAGGLYIWARTAVDFVLSRLKKRGEINRDQWMEDVGRLGMADVNALYMLILKRYLQDDVDDEDETAMRRTKEVLGLITVAQNPLPLDDIVGFLGYKDFDVRNFVRMNRSILVPGTQEIAGPTIPQFHKTFSDFLTSDSAEHFQTKAEDAHHSVALRCFELMDSHLRFNICRLRSSFSPSEGLDELVASIPGGLIYASTSWWYHLEWTQRDSGSHLLLRSLLPFIKAFLYEKLLFWLEVVSLSKKAEDSASWLEGLANQLQNSKLAADLDELGLSIYAKDASLLVKEFIQCFGVSIPHIYISLLGASPRDCIVANHYRKLSAATVVPHPSGMPPRWNSWDKDPRMVDDNSVNSISFSPCGRRLAAGYEDNEIRVWDVENGECQIGPWKGHNDDVNSVCFSPNGLLIASGSDDETIRVWDAETGDCVLGPLTGHAGFVWSVSFSPDSTRIASGSRDGTVRVWDVRTGDCVLGPLEGHSTWDVRSVSYSPDGSCVASGSNDHTIGFWNAQTGACMCGPLGEGHDECGILTLSFHPDGGRLVSGSGDKTLRIWDVEKGTCTHGPLTGHGRGVLSVCFSPDGQYIASGSNDCTVCIWNAETAVCVAGPFGGASDGVTSLAFSPEGKYLAAGSRDDTIRLWDFSALLSMGLCGSSSEDEAVTGVEITDHTVLGDKTAGMKGWTLGPNGELLFWAPKRFRSAIWRPSTVRILGRPSMIKPDLSNLVTGEEWLSCFPSP